MIGMWPEEAICVKLQAGCGQKESAIQSNITAVECLTIVAGCVCAHFGWGWGGE